MEKTRQARRSRRVQVCLTETQYSVFRDIASKLYPGDARTDGVDISKAGRQAILDWIRANGTLLQDNSD